MRDYTTGPWMVYGKVLERLSARTGETEDRLEVILDEFWEEAKRGLVAPKRYFPIPDFGAFWRVDGEAEFCAYPEKWPDLGMDLGVPARNIVIGEDGSARYVETPEEEDE